MKKSLLHVIVLLSSMHVTGQQSTIKVDAKHHKDSVLTLHLLTGDGHSAEPLLQIKKAQEGFFMAKLDIATPTFALVNTQEQAYRILLIPQKELIMSIDTSTKDMPQFSGSAGASNELLTKIRIGSIVFFGLGDPMQNTYAKFSSDSLDRFVYEAVMTEIKNAEKLIDQSAIDPSIKDLIRSEYKYYYQANLVHFSKNLLRWAKNPAEDIFRNKVMKSIVRPDSAALVSGFYANMILSDIIQETMQKPQRGLSKPTSQQKETLSQELFGVDFDNVKEQAEKYGERYMLTWLYSKKHLPPAIQDKILFNKILDAHNDGSIRTALVLTDTLRLYFPASRYLSQAGSIAASINRNLEEQGANTRIRFHEYNRDTSFAALFKPYAGKLIYVDIWGTWCGPCKAEMKYVGELKKNFEGKNIVFVYLDMDDKQKHETWKEYVRFYGIEGDHFRFDQQQIESFWNEVRAAGGTTNSYPAYLIFDKSGRLINSSAARPSSKEVLYDQLKKLL